MTCWIAALMCKSVISKHTDALKRSPYRRVTSYSEKGILFKGKEIEDMDVEAILRIHPEIVIVDKLAHSNIEVSTNKKRWQDVEMLLDAGINVISAVNIQHIESVKEEVQKISGIVIKERIPNSVLKQAHEVVNID